MGGGGGADGAFILGMVCGFVVVFAIVLMIISAIMRFAVVLANKTLGTGAPSRRSYDDDWDDDWDAPRYRRGRSGAGIPEPSFGKGVLIAFVAYLINAAASFAIGAMLGVGLRGMGGAVGPGGAAPAMLLAQLMSLAVSFLIWSGILTAMLPTSFGRAALVTLYMILISIAIAILIMVPIGFIIFAARP